MHRVQTNMKAHIDAHNKTLLNKKEAETPASELCKQLQTKQVKLR